jgi:hypothetical protein
MDRFSILLGKEPLSTDSTTVIEEWNSNSAQTIMVDPGPTMQIGPISFTQSGIGGSEPPLGIGSSVPRTGVGDSYGLYVSGSGFYAAAPQPELHIPAMEEILQRLTNIENSLTELRPFIAACNGINPETLPLLSDRS